MINKDCNNCKHLMSTGIHSPCATCGVSEYDYVDNWEFADWVNVIRCKNCKEYNNDLMYCRLLKIDIMPNQYCSLRGKKK